DQRGGVSRRVGRAEQQVDRPGPEGRRAHAGLPGQPAVGLRHERRALLVPGQHVLDGRLRQRLHQPDVLLAGDAEDVGDALVLQALDDQLGGGTRLLGHVDKRNGARFSRTGRQPAFGRASAGGRMDLMTADDAAKQISELEARRYQAMTAADLPVLEELFSADLVYTHSDASADSKQSYL